MNLINENKLLLYCVQKSIPETPMSRIKDLIVESLKWEWVVDSAFAENIAPLLYYNLKDFRKTDHIPQEALDKLRKAYYGNVVRNMHLFSELRRILEAFNKKNIDIMVLKGAALANTVYGDIGLRSMWDIDLLVKQEDLSRAKAMMFDLDYIVSPEVPSEEWYKKHHFHLPPFIHNKKFIGVEIHWNIASKSFDIDVKKWWERALTAEIEKCQALIPSPEDMLIHLCLNPYHQGYKAGIIKRGIGDICQTLKHYEEIIDWNLFQDEINLCKINKPAYSMLYLIKEFFDTGDISLVKFNMDHIDMKFIKILRDRILMSSDFPGPFIKYYVADGFSDKAKALFEGVFPEREVMAKNCSIPLTSRKLYFYYLIRPFALLSKYGKILLETFRI